MEGGKHTMPRTFRGGASNHLRLATRRGLHITYSEEECLTRALDWVGRQEPVISHKGLVFRHLVPF